MNLKMRSKGTSVAAAEAAAERVAEADYFNRTVTCLWLFL